MIKGIAILMVILLHSIPGEILFNLFSFFWLGQAVPLFILIQAYHIKNAFVLKGKNLSFFYSWTNIMKISKRVIFPFSLLLIVQVFLTYFLGKLNWKEVIGSGGIGPGSYYIYIYLEIAFLAPLLYCLMRNWSWKSKLLIFILLSEIFELFCSYLMIPDNFYRLLFFRYFFLIYLGFEIDLKKISLNLFKISLAVIGIFFIITDVYMDVDYMPLIYYTGWKGYHWLAYFYTAYVFIYFLKYLYGRTSEKFRNFFCFMGKYSYEIFLLQMLIFGIDIYAILDVPYTYHTFLIFFPIKIILCILPVFLWKMRQYRLSDAITDK